VTVIINSPEFYGFTEHSSVGEIGESKQIEHKCNIRSWQRAVMAVHCSNL